ncbi:hypothetical protein BY458DRAFT_591466 [Sporodiniella umbellata]|nr:hypothetical protein BY458DRAFT_591466 [Sporodiniella umbellata]
MFASTPMKRELEDDSDMLVLDPSQYYSSFMDLKPHWNPPPCHALASMDLQSIFNLSNFQLLSQEKRDELCQLLPTVDTLPQSSSLTISPSLFSKQGNPVFWNTLDEWQQRLSPQSPPVKKHPKKHKLSHKKEDAFWDSDKDKTTNVAGDSKSVTLKDMCRKGLIREQDVIVYKRNFSACKTIVCKSMTVIKASCLSGITIQLDGHIFQDFETPTALETKVLDHHGMVAKDKRPNGNAFKSIRLIRDGKEMGRLFDIRKESFEDL